MCKISDDPLKLISSVLEVNIMLYNGEREREKKDFFLLVRWAGHRGPISSSFSNVS